MQGSGADIELADARPQLHKERRAALVEWLLLPEAERQPRTKKAFADLWGVSPETIRTDSSDPRVQNELIRRGRQLRKAESTLKIVDALYARAMGAESEAAANTAAKLWLDWTAQDTGAADVDFESMSDDELYDALIRLREATQNR